MKQRNTFQSFAINCIHSVALVVRGNKTGRTKIAYILLISLMLVSCIRTSNENINTESDTLQQKVTVMSDTTPKVTGIGGIFFRSENPEEVREWYGTNLGLAIDPYGSAFEFRNANRPDEINYLRWSPFEEGTDYFDPSNKEFMINYRVQNI